MEREGAISQVEYRLEMTDPLAPLMVCVHGRAGNKNVMSPFRRVIPQGWSTLWVQAPKPDPLGGYSWWLVNESEDPYPSGPFLYNILQEIEISEGLTPKARGAMGFSQGGAVLSLIIQQYPEFFRSVALLASFVLRTKDYALSAILPRIFIVHGTEDEVVPREKAEQGASFLEERGYKVRMSLDPVGHKIGSEGMKALKVWWEEEEVFLAARGGGLP